MGACHHTKCKKVNIYNNEISSSKYKNESHPPFNLQENKEIPCSNNNLNHLPFQYKKVIEKQANPITSPFSTTINRSENSNYNNKTFLPHLYNSLSNDQIRFYKNMNEIKKLNSENKLYFVKDFNKIDEFLDFLREYNKETSRMKELLIVWKLFKWIGVNIKCKKYASKFFYEEVYFDNIFLPKSLESNRISKFAKFILDRVGIESILIKGYLKGNHTKEIFRENHEWNAVKLFDIFWLIDFSLACQVNEYYDFLNLGNDKEINQIDYSDKLCNEFFFCTPPQHFIYSHYPTEIRHSFLDQGMYLIDKQDFESMPNYSNFFFIYGFQLFDFKDTEINLKQLSESSLFNTENNEFMFSFCLPSELTPIISVEITNHDTKNKSLQIFNNNQSPKNFLTKTRKFDREQDKNKIALIDYYIVYESYYKETFFQDFSSILDNLYVYETTVRIGEKTNFEINIFCFNSKKNKTTKIEFTDEKSLRSQFSQKSNISLDLLDYCYSYKIKNNLDNFNPLSLDKLFFPRINQNYRLYDCTIIEPLFLYLERFLDKRYLNFVIKVPRCYSVAIFYDDQEEMVIMTNTKNSIWSYTHDTEKKFKNLVIAVSQDESLNFVTVCSFQFSKEY
jgi:hypothetical protein